MCVVPAAVPQLRVKALVGRCGAPAADQGLFPLGRYSHGESLSELLRLHTHIQLNRLGAFHLQHHFRFKYSGGCLQWVT